MCVCVCVCVYSANIPMTTDENMHCVTLPYCLQGHLHQAIFFLLILVCQTASKLECLRYHDTSNAIIY